MSTELAPHADTDKGPAPPASDVTARPGDASPTARWRDRVARARRYAVPPLIAFVLFLSAWQGAIVAFDISAYLLPGPVDIARAVTDSVGRMVEPMMVTAQSAYLGFGIALAGGFLSALFMARWNVVERGMYPYLVILQTIPIIAVAPLFVVWFGAGLKTNALVSAMIAVFPVAANSLQGLKSTDRNLVQLYRMAGAPPRVQLFSLRVPAALPHVLTGMRIAAGTSVIGAIVGEFVAGIGGGAGGLGYVITLNATQLRTADLFVAVMLASVISLVLFGLVAFVERRLLGRWHESAMPTEE